MELIISTLIMVLIFVVGYAAYGTVARRRGGTGRSVNSLHGRISSATGGDAILDTSMGNAGSQGGDKKGEVDPAFTEMLSSVTRIVRRFSGLPLLSNLLFTPENLRRTGKRLVHAGSPFNMDAEQWISVNLFAVVTVFVYGVYSYSQEWMSLIQMGIYVGLVMLVPPLWLNSRIKSRSEELERELPNVINKLILASMGNQDIVTTLTTVVEYTRGHLTDEIRQTLREAKYHREKNYSDVFREMADRCGNQNVTGFCNTIINSITVRANVTSLLREQQGAMKEIRKANNEAAINRTETYLMFSAALGIMCVMVIVAAPSMLAVMQGLSTTPAGG